ncbi:hypothetical protein BH11BAC1_BH11BAC1_08660 [soil metagenome]
MHGYVRIRYLKEFPHLVLNSNQIFNLPGKSCGHGGTIWLNDLNDLICLFFQKLSNLAN